MVESSKILTVSYGTFSCTLEGFDDSFATMKAIAEYFRDLAERDRYFGAEPPTPDAEMLTRIAEREIERRVEARMNDGRLVLRAAEADAGASGPATSARAPMMPPAPVAPEDQAAPFASAPEATPTYAEPAAPAPQTAEPSTAYAAEDDFDTADDQDDSATAFGFDDMSPAAFSAAPSVADPSSVAAKLQRIRDVVGSKPAPETANDIFDDNISGTEPEPEFHDELAEADETESVKTEASEATSEVEPLEDMPSEQSEPIAEVETATVAEESSVAETTALADTSDTAELITEPQVQPEAEGQDTPEAEVEPSTPEETVAKAEADVPSKAEPAAPEQSEATAPAEAEAAPKQSIRARILRVARPLRPTPVEKIAQDLSADDSGPDLTPNEADLDTAETKEPADVQKVTARVRTKTETETVEEIEQPIQEAAPADDQMNGLAFDQTTQVDPIAEEPLQLETTAEVEPVEATTVSTAPVSLSDEDELSLQQELAEVEREIEADKANNKQGRDILPETDDAAMSRILSRTDAQLAEPENSRRRNAIAQLKAAVAATEAARQLGDKPAARKAEDDFRSDLSEVVRPRRASTLPKAEIRTERPKPAPLKLVAEQRVDAPRQVPSQPVQPRRVMTPADPVNAENFADFASKMGATDLEDMLEAAAAYTSFVEGNEDFSRPQIMQKVQAASQTGYSREDSLRSFGTLLREGRISKVRNGRFQISDKSRFNPERKAG